MQNERRKAPWLDYAGNPIHEGDALVHPAGDRGVVVYYPNGRPGVSFDGNEADKWFVEYSGDGNENRLCLQIGNKGQAVVELVESKAESHGGELQPGSTAYYGNYSLPLDRWRAVRVESMATPGEYWVQLQGQRVLADEGFTLLAPEVYAKDCRWQSAKLLRIAEEIEGLKDG